MSLAPPCYGARQGERVILDFVAATVDIFLTPPSFGHLPYILLCKTQRRRVRCIPLSLLLRFYIRHLVRLLGTAGEEFCDVIMRFCRWGPKVFCMFILSCTCLMLSLGKITWIIPYNDETRKVYSSSDGYQPGKTTGGTYGVGRGNGEKCS